MPVFSYPAEPAPSLLFQHLLLTWNSLLSKSKVSSSSARIIVVILMNDRLIISLNAMQAESVGPYPFQRLWKKSKSIILLLLFHFLLDWMRVRYKGPGYGEGGGGNREVHTSRLPYLAVPASISFILGFLPLALFRLQNIDHGCIVPFPTSSPSSHPFSTPTFVPIFLPPSVPILSPSVPACPFPVLPHWFVWDN